MTQPTAESHASPAWEKTAMLVVYALAAAAFLYLGYAYYTQRTFRALISELLSGDAARGDAAAAKLAATDDSLPYLTDALVNRPDPEDRALAAKVIRRRVEARLNRVGAIEGREETQRLLRPGLDLEAITRALSDESPEVRAATLAVVDLVGTNQNYQVTRLDEMREYEGLLAQLASPDKARQTAAAEAFRTAGDRALPFLVGVVFSGDKGLRMRGLTALRASVQEILRSSNARRIVPLLERRRCRLLLRELTRLDEAERPLVTGILNVSGRLPQDIFSAFLHAWPTLDAAGRDGLLAERVEFLELEERLRGATPPEIEKAGKLYDKTGQ